MLSLKQPLDDKIRINGQEYDLDLSFDNVLRWYDLMDDKKIDDMLKIMLAFEMFVPDCEADSPTMVQTVNAIVKEYITAKPDDGQETSNQTQYYDFNKDAEYIFASFLQEYGIDLLDQQGIMQWEKFIALFNGLRSDTKFMKIVGIRSAELPTGNSEYEIAERKRMVELKNIYTLDPEQSRQEQEARMDKMFDNLVNMAKKGGTLS
ncbi:Gp15 family bacteriophage protein [Sporolactobacillus sp. CQH2019]|uniref:Gp15 family bacteriophage protein n=1 Tax=Sporolactobacillus sp. CQH2019 TaxID=3023512 RepID=UPI00236791E1|nr:Gp15 family bacteriophage protein [Sporolactobacillus sp. CQH2019]MDD9147823.1 Gp15 family bacteriophage protein [Sporolactobacillus sp. CQH2019]